MKKQKGLTLVELIAVMAISAVLGAIILSMFSVTGKLFTAAQQESFFNDEARVAFRSIEDDIRTASYVATDVSVSDGKIQIPNVGAVEVGFEKIPLVVSKKVKSTDAAGNVTTTTETYVYCFMENNKQLSRKRVSAVKQLEEISDGISNVKALSINKASDGRYNIKISFEDSKNNTNEYETVVTPRNS